MRINEILEPNKGKKRRPSPDWKVEERKRQAILDGTTEPDMFSDDGQTDIDQDNQIIDNDIQV